MNRAFKTQFHNGEPDEKPIVTMSLAVNNGKRFKALSRNGKENLISEIERFEQSIIVFKKELMADKK